MKKHGKDLIRIGAILFLFNLVKPFVFSNISFGEGLAGAGVCFLMILVGCILEEFSGEVE